LKSEAMGQTTASLGVLTLGQSPRRDVTPTLQTILGAAVQIHEAGGLDGLSSESIATLAPRPGEIPIETCLRSGEPILVSKDRLLTHLVRAGSGLLALCGRVLLLCSGEFPALTAACPGLIMPATLLRGVIRAVAGEQTLGVMGPATDMERAPAQWAPLVRTVVCSAASPYDRLPVIETAGRRLAKAGYDFA
jgi:protein AroM